MKSRKNVILYSCLMVLYIFAPFLMFYLYAQRMSIANTNASAYFSYVYVITYLLPVLYGVLYAVLLWLCLKMGREVLLAVFALVSAFWAFWGTNLCYYSINPVRLPTLFWFDWMQDGWTFYQDRLLAVQQVGATVALVFLAIALAGRVKRHWKETHS